MLKQSNIEGEKQNMTQGKIPKLPDVLKTGLDVVFCGTAAGKESAAQGYYYAGPGNKFWDILYETRLTDRKLKPRECFECPNYGIGFTDLEKFKAGGDRTVGAGASEKVKGKIIKWRPKILAFNGKNAAAHFLGYGDDTGKVFYGLHASKVDTTMIFVLPSTAGTANRYWDERHWLELAKTIEKIQLKSRNRNNRGRWGS